MERNKAVRTKNIIAILFFALLGLGIVFMIIYPFFMEKINLKSNEELSLTYSDYIWLVVGFVFVFGSSKFKDIVNLLFDIGKRYIQKKAGLNNENSDSKSS